MITNTMNWNRRQEEIYSHKLSWFWSLDINFQFKQKYKLTLGGLITVVGSDGKPTQVAASSLGQLGGAIGGACGSGGAGIYIFFLNKRFLSSPRIVIRQKNIRISDKKVFWRVKIRSLKRIFHQVIWKRFKL